MARRNTMENKKEIIRREQLNFFDSMLGIDKESSDKKEKLMVDPNKIMEKWPDDRLKRLFVNYYNPDSVRLALSALYKERKREGIYATLDDKDKIIKETEDAIASIFLINTPDLTKANYGIAKAMAVELNSINNGGYLIVTRDAKGVWCVMGDTSAALYAYDANIGGSFKTRPKMSVDSDLNNKFKDGLTYIHGFRSLVEKLFAVGIVYWANLENGVWIFRLDHIRSPEELEYLRTVDRRLTEEVRRLIMADNIYPDFYGMINRLSKIVSSRVRRMDKMSKETFGVALVQDVMELHNCYIMMANKKIEEQEQYIEKINEKILTIGAWLDVMLENRYVDKDTLGRMANQLSDIKVRARSIEKEIKKKNDKRRKRTDQSEEILAGS